jgi:hypothetical protein
MPPPLLSGLGSAVVARSPDSYGGVEGMHERKRKRDVE